MNAQSEVPRAAAGAARFFEHSGHSTLDVAARSVIDAFGLATDQSTVIAERALRHCWEPLRQYLMIRVPESEALAALADLEASIEQHAPNDGAGPRAVLYSLARAVFAGRSVRLSSQAPEWWLPRRASVRYAKQLQSMRATLDPATFEIAELGYTRRLKPNEIAFVLALPVAEVEQRLRACEEIARGLFGDAPESMTNTLEGALLEAFSLRAGDFRPAPRAPLLQPGDVVSGRYKIATLLGTGAFADVYKATDLEVPDHVVALKLFRRVANSGAARDGALRELRLIASVSHPSVVQYKDHGWHEGRAFFAMPFYRGETLRQRLSRGPLSRREAQVIFVPLARALATMHAAGVRHQDIKPENIFLAQTHDDDDLLPILIDMGVAAKDAENVLAGTPNYFPPEVAARFVREPDPPPVTGKADVFSLALVLRNALDPDSEEQVAGGAVDAFVHYRARLAPVPPHGRELAFVRPWFERWLHLAPDSRPTAEELARELAVLTQPEERRARMIATLRWLAPIVVVLAAVFSVIVVVLTHQAKVHKLEAERARLLAEEESQRATRVGAERDEVRETNRALKEDVARLEDEYRSSRLTRLELAEKLAQIEGAYRHLLKKSEAELKTLEATLQQRADEQEQALRRLDSANSSLDAERKKLGTLETELAEATLATELALHERDEARRQLEELRATPPPRVPLPLPQGPSAADAK